MLCGYAGSAYGQRAACASLFQRCDRTCYIDPLRNLRCTDNRPTIMAGHLPAIGSWQTVATDGRDMPDHEGGTTCRRDFHPIACSDLSTGTAALTLPISRTIGRRRSAICGPHVIITITIFDNAGAALVSNEKATAWVRNNVPEFARGMPEVMVGDVLIAEVK